MKDSTIYRRAAAEVAVRDWYSCCAIENVQKRANIGGEFSPAAQRYNDLFNPDPRASFWIRLREDGTYDYNTRTVEVQQWRVLALLFMACVAEDEE